MLNQRHHNSLPQWQFQTLLTLFPKFFSYFPHGTSLLSISREQLALDEVYHPIYTPITRSTTRRKQTGCIAECQVGTLTLNGRPFQGSLWLRVASATSKAYNLQPSQSYHFELYPSSLAATGGFPVGFFYSASIICLNSAGSLARVQLQM